MKRFLIFILSFNLSLTVFLLPWGFSFYTKEEVKEAESPVIIPPKKEALILVDKGEEALIFLHMKLSLNECEISVLPLNLKARDTDGFIPISEINKNGGLKYVVRALNKNPRYKIDVYSSVDIEAVEKAFKPLGSCDFDLQYDILGENGELFFSKGRTLLNIDNAALILEKAASPKVSVRQEIFAETVSQLLNRESLTDKENAEGIFNLLANGRDSSFSIGNFLNFKKYGLFQKGFKFKVK